MEKNPLGLLARENVNVAPASGSAAPKVPTVAPDTPSCISKSSVTTTRQLKLVDEGVRRAAHVHTHVDSQVGKGDTRGALVHVGHDDCEAIGEREATAVRHANCKAQSWCRLEVDGACNVDGGATHGESAATPVHQSVPVESDNRSVSK